MDNIILGLLLLGERTVYELRKRIDKGLGLMYSSSTGSIQAALKKLLERGHIDYGETVENGKYKKVYRITESGRQTFLAWVNAPAEQAGIRFPGLVKIYFMGLAAPENREAYLESFLASLREQHAALEAICGEAEAIPVPESARDILRCQQMTALFGRDLMKFSIGWFENLLGKIRSGEK